MNLISRTVGCGLAILIATSLTLYAQEKYTDFEDAYSEAARLQRRGEPAVALIGPLEAAVALAKDDAQRLKAYQALVSGYRQLPEIDKMLMAQEFIIRHTDRKAGRSLAARSLVSFVFERGKLDALIERCDGLLKQNPNDPAAVNTLAIIFTTVKRNDPRGPELKQRLADLDRELGQQFAQRLEKDAESAPRTTAWLLKDAATAWLEAGDKVKALAIAKKSAASAPEQRNGQLAQMWHEGLGDVFLQTGEPQLAVAEFEAALSITEQPVQRQGLEKKLNEARGASTKK